MIRARLSLDEAQCIAGFSASGHAGSAPRGSDIACAAFTALARTAYRSLEGLPGIELRGRAGGRGELDFEVARKSSDPGRARGIADFLAIGLGDLARDYPDALSLTIEHVSEG